ncbi:MAG: efflux RND transporter periplasmic adaptor subunit [Aquabacterium sp.]
MKLNYIPYLSSGVVAALLAVYASHLSHAASTEEAPASSDITRTAPNELRYRPGSPQLAYLAIDTVKPKAPPALEPLPARITFDEDHTVRVFSPVAGRTQQIVAQPGQQVHAGDVLAWLLAPDYDTALADLHKAQADHDSKKAAFERAQRLHEAGVIATRDLEAAQADARSAQAELERTSAHMHELGSVGRDGRFALRAPISGVVADRHLNPGQELRPDAADPAFTITDPAHLDVVADVAESDVGKLHVGQAVRIENGDASLPDLNGRIATVGVTMDPNTRRVPVRAHLIAPPATARPEMFVRMAPLGDTPDQAMAVPNSAIVTTGLQSFVFVERSPGLLVKTQVALARRGRDLSYVKQGLNAGDRVVTKGAILLDAELASDS